MKVVGVRMDSDDPHEQYYMTGFRDEAHYNDFVEKMKTNPEYQEMTEKINQHRESIEVHTLVPAEDR